MSFLFCYDGPIMKDDNGNYYGTALNDEMFERYKLLSNDINIIIRVNNLKQEEISNKYSTLSKNEYSVIECPNLSSLKGILIDRKKAKKLLEDNIKKSDYIIIRLPSVIGNLAVKIAKKLNKPYLVEVVGCPWGSLWNHSIKGKLVAPFITYSTKKNVKYAPYVLYVTEKFLQKRYPTNGKQISCSDVIIDTSNRNVLKNKLERIESKNSTTITMATLAAVNVKYKGQQDVIKAVYELKKLGKVVKYKIIGGGDDSYLRSLTNKYNLQENIEFLGNIPHENIFDILDDIDIYIQPSKQEGLPRAVIEAMSRACLCIGTNVGGTPELLEKQYIYKKGDINQLIKLIDNVTKKELISQANRNFNESCKYEKNILIERRKKFFLEYKENCDRGEGQND